MKRKISQEDSLKSKTNEIKDKSTTIRKRRNDLSIFSKIKRKKKFSRTKLQAKQIII